MTVNATQVAAGGSYIAVSSEHATLTTALKEVIDELEAQGAPWVQTQIAISINPAGDKYGVIAIVKRH